MKQPTRMDISRAAFVIRWSDELKTNWLQDIPEDNDPRDATLTDDQLSDIRSEMKRYEETEANIGEDKAFYDARFRLQHLDTVEKDNHD